MFPLDRPITDDSSSASVIGRSEVTAAMDPIFGVLADSDLDAPVGLDSDAWNDPMLRASFYPKKLEKWAHERRTTLPASIRQESHHLSPWLRSPDDLDLYMRHYSGALFPPERVEAAASGVASPILEVASPFVQLPAGNQYLADIPRCTSPLELGNEHDATASVNCRGSTSSALLKSLEYAIPLTNGDTPPHFPLGLLGETRGFSHESRSTPMYPTFSPSTSHPASIRNKLGSQLTQHEQSNALDGVDKDPEALLDNHNVNVADPSRPDPSFVATALVTALGVLTSYSSNPKAAVFQLCAAAISLTLIALHSFRAISSPNTRSTLMQQLLKHFPMFISASCSTLFLLSVIFASPKAMTLTIFLVIFASIPMVFGARLPMALTLAIITLFTLTFLALVFLVCLLPVEWLE